MAIPSIKQEPARMALDSYGVPGTPGVPFGKHNGTLGQTETTVWISAGILFRVATEAYARAKEKALLPETNPFPANSPENRFVQSDPLTAIIFSAGALEAFINEAIELAGQVDIPVPGVPSRPPSVESFARAGKNLLISRAHIRKKFDRARAIFAGTPYEKEANPYQDFSLLIDLRNDILHLKGSSKIVEFLPMKLEHPPIIDCLRPKGILAEFPQDGADWMMLISTPAAAKWACNVAFEMVQGILGIIPACLFKTGMDVLYGRMFRPVD
jgi:hypothetical protein